MKFEHGVHRVTDRGRHAQFASKADHGAGQPWQFQPVAAFQNTRFKMADMRTEIDVAQAFVDQCVLQHNKGKLSAEDAAKAKLFTSELEGRVTDECLQLHGGAGYMDEYPISRMYTAARVSRIYAGSSEIMREIIARSIGLDPRKASS